MSEAPIPAATLILVRETGGGRAPELLMVERAQGMAFAGGAMVFPGGRIDATDLELASARGDEDAAAKVASIRETIEETAVPVGLSPLPDAELALKLQRDLAAGRAFTDLLAELRLKISPDELTPLARWVPSFHARRRFDTLFFIAAAPPGEWQPHPLQGECTGAMWISASDALERDRAGQVQLIFPTRRTLERLDPHSTFGEMLADAQIHSIEPITPWVEEIEGEKFVNIPDDLGFPVTRERLEGLWRG